MHRNYPLIDAHMHIYHVSGFEKMLAIAREAGLEAMNFLSISQYDRPLMAQNAMGMALKAANPGKVYFFAGLHHHLPGASAADTDLAQQARRMAALGCDGFKILESKPNCYKRVGEPLDGPQFAPFFEYVESSGLPVVWHVVDPEVCWDSEKCPQWFREAGYFYDESFPTQRHLRDQVETVLRRHPKLRVTFAHFYFLSPDIREARRFLAEHKSAHLDLTPGDEMYINFSRDVAGWREFFTEHPDRIVLGTDNCDTQATAQMGELSTGANNVRRILKFLETDETIASFSGGRAHGLSLDPPVVAKIAGGNFLRLAGRSPRKLDIAKCLEYCQWLTPFARQSEVSEQIMVDLAQAVDELSSMGEERKE